MLAVLVSGVMGLSSNPAPRISGMVIDSFNIRHVGAWSYGPAFVVEGSDSIAYLSAGAGVHVLDMSDPGLPVKVSSFQTSGLVLDLTADSTLLYIAEEAAGVEIWDVSSPDGPALLSRIMDIPLAYRISVEDSLLFVSMMDSGMAVIDIRDPINPQFLGQLVPYIGCPVMDIATYGNYAYLACGDSGIVIADISNPSDPSFASRITPGNITLIEVRDSNLFATGLDAGFLVYDLSSPTNPSQVGSYVSFAYPSDLAIYGNSALIVENIGTLYVLDISDPENPTRTVYYYNDDLFTGVSIVGSTALITGVDSSLMMVDISNPSSPQLLGTYPTPRSSERVGAHGSMAVTLDDYGMRVFDIENPSSPVFTAHVQGSEWVQDADVYDGYGFLADEYDLRIYDLSDPYSPIQVGTYSAPGYISDIEIMNGKAYLADGYSGLVIVDVSDPANPLELGSVSTYGYMSRVSTNGTMVLISEYDKVHLVDASNPSSPTIASTMQFNDFISGLAFLGNDYAVITEYDSLMHIFDITDPTSPVEVATVRENGTIHSLSTAPPVAFIITKDFFTRLIAINLYDPLNPSEVGIYTLPFPPGEVHATEDAIFVAGMEGGFHIYQFYGTDTGERPIASPVDVRWITPGMLDIMVNANSSIQLQIYDVKGRLILRRDLKPGETRVRYRLPAGAYILKLGPTTRKFIVTR